MIKTLSAYKAGRYAIYVAAWLLMIGSGLIEIAKFAAKVIDLNCGTWWALVQQSEASHRRKTA